MNTAFYALMQLREVLDEAGLLSAYYALAYTVLSCNVLVWGRGKDWIRVFTAQKRILRLVFNLGPLDSCRPYFRSEGLLTFPSIFIYKAVCFVQSNLQSFATPQHNHNTRGKDLLRLDHHATSLFERSPNYCFAKLYNKLPSSIKNQESVHIFKKKAKEFLLEGGYYSLQEYLAS